MVYGINVCVCLYVSFVSVHPVVEVDSVVVVEVRMDATIHTFAIGMHSTPHPIRSHVPDDACLVFFCLI